MSSILGRCYGLCLEYRPRHESRAHAPRLVQEKSSLSMLLIHDGLRKFKCPPFQGAEKCTWVEIDHSDAAQRPECITLGKRDTGSLWQGRRARSRDLVERARDSATGESGASRLGRKSSPRPDRLPVLAQSSSESRAATVNWQRAQWKPLAAKARPVAAAEKGWATRARGSEKGLPEGSHYASRDACSAGMYTPSPAASSSLLAFLRCENPHVFEHSTAPRGAGAFRIASRRSARSARRRGEKSSSRPLAPASVRLPASGGSDPRTNGSTGCWTTRFPPSVFRRTSGM